MRFPELPARNVSRNGWQTLSRYLGWENGDPIIRKGVRETLESTADKPGVLAVSRFTYAAKNAILGPGLSFSCRSWPQLVVFGFGMPGWFVLLGKQLGASAG